VALRKVKVRAVNPKTSGGIAVRMLFLRCQTARGLSPLLVLSCGNTGLVGLTWDIEIATVLQPSDLFSLRTKLLFFHGHLLCGPRSQFIQPPPPARSCSTDALPDTMAKRHQPESAQFRLR
jgi:hypothetical protein